MKELITAQMATYPARKDILPIAVGSLLPQVDRLNVMLNGYEFGDVPECCRHPKVRVNYLNNSMTDAAKFYKIEYAVGYVFTTDDDILYPTDYVANTIAKIEEYGRKYVITYHGRVWNKRPIRNFYTDRLAMYRCLEGFYGDHIVDCAGDGVSAWHTDTFMMHFAYCERKNMSQLWFALACNKAGVKQMAVGHPEGWFKDLTIDLEDTIWSQEINDCSFQTSLVNERWIER